MSPTAASTGACPSCLARTWLLARLAGHLDRVRARIDELIELDDSELIDAVGGDDGEAIRAEHASLDSPALRAAAIDAGLEQICCCDPRFPQQLLELRVPPAVLHIAGGLDRFLASIGGQESVAIVGARRGSEYGNGVARSLASALGSVGVPLISGMAIGIDSAAHVGALDSGGFTVAVLPGGADRAYPRGKRALHARIVSNGTAVSELPPGVSVRRWMFPARNRLIAALATMTVVVEAAARSGALLTAAAARDLGRPIGAVPGRVTSRLAEGPNQLIASGAADLISGPQGMLDALFGAGVRDVPARTRATLDDELEHLLALIDAGSDTLESLMRRGVDVDQGLAALSALELAGYVRREAGGRYSLLA